MQRDTAAGHVGCVLGALLKRPNHALHHSAAMWQQTSIGLLITGMPGAVQAATGNDLESLILHLLPPRASKPLCSLQMEGCGLADREDWGLIPFAVDELLRRIGQASAGSYLVTLSYVELYREQLTDLLANPGRGEGDCKDVSAALCTSSAAGCLAVCTPPAAACPCCVTSVCSWLLMLLRPVKG